MAGAEKIYKSLLEHNVDELTIERIMEGYNEISKGNKQEKAAFIAEVIKRMDNLLTAEIRNEIIDWCACCKGGVRDRDIKKFIKDYNGKSLDEKVIGLRNVQNMGNPVLYEDGTITTGIFWRDKDEYKCPCTCFSGIKLKDSVSISYCYCCAGHFRYHYQNALSVKLKTQKVVSSVLESQGKSPCQFVFEIEK